MQSFFMPSCIIAVVATTYKHSYWILQVFCRPNSFYLRCVCALMAAAVTHSTFFFAHGEPAIIIDVRFVCLLLRDCKGAIVFVVFRLLAIVCIGWLRHFVLLLCMMQFCGILTVLCISLEAANFQANAVFKIDFPLKTM